VGKTTDHNQISGLCRGNGIVDLDICCPSGDKEKLVTVMIMVKMRRRLGNKRGRQNGKPHIKRSFCVMASIIQSANKKARFT
jgi:hypothetical protein